jgi:hypothetical protein
MYIILYSNANNGRQQCNLAEDMDTVKMLIRRIKECTEHMHRLYKNIVVYKLGEQVQIEQKELEF